MTPRTRSLGSLRSWLLLAGLAAGPLAGTLSAASAGVSFTKDIAPILAKKCVTCHGPEKAKGNYQLHNFEMLLKPGASKATAVIPGQPAKSELFRLLVTSDADDRMPQKDDPLPKAQIALVEKWIQQGAKFDGPDAKAHLAALIPRVPYPNPPASYPQPVPVAAGWFYPMACPSPPPGPVRPATSCSLHSGTTTRPRPLCGSAARRTGCIC